MVRRGLRCGWGDVLNRALGELAPWSHYPSPRSLSIKSAAVPAGRRRAGQSANGSPASTGSRTTPAATRSSYRVRRPERVALAGGPSSATTRPCAVTAIRSPASIRRTYRLRLSLSSRMPVEVMCRIIATCSHIRNDAYRAVLNVTERGYVAPKFVLSTAVRRHNPGSHFNPLALSWPMDVSDCARSALTNA